MNPDEKHHIAVIGPIPRDHITTHLGEVIEKYGCVMHPAIGLSRLLDNQGTVHVVSHVRKQDERPIKDQLDRYPNIDFTQLTSKADQGDVIRLKFLDQNKRVERQTGFMNPILAEDLQNLLHCDAFVFVPITDYEVPLETLKYVRENSRGVIIFDAHGPTNAVSTVGDRFLRFWIDRDQWLPYIDVLKMNLEESRCCWFEKEYQADSPASVEAGDTSHLPAFARHVIERGVKSLIVTLDSMGSAVFFEKGGKIQQEVVSAIWVENVIDTTGCGDSFAGGLGFGLLNNPIDYIGAARYANALGAQRAQGRTFEVFKSLEETNLVINEHYGNI